MSRSGGHDRCGGVRVHQLHQSSLGDTDSESPAGPGGREEKENTLWQVRLHHFWSVSQVHLALMRAWFWFRLNAGVWEDRAILARLKQKLKTEDGRLVLCIEQEEWKVA